MLLTDYLRSDKDITWDFARQCGVKHGVIRLPETPDFDITDETHWRQVHKGFTDFGITPIIIEPMPNELHDHIKAGDEKRDESIEKAFKMLPIMEKLGITTICFNFMAHIGWLRTSSDIRERGGALVTGFDLADFVPTDKKITADELWANYEYFIRAMLPHCEKHGIKLALHPDDPPLPRLGDVERIMISYENIKKAINLIPSENLGVTMCQACYQMMGEDLYRVIPELAEKIFFVHFRNATGNKYKFHETFHDNGDIAMADILRLYQKCNVDVPIRVDHVPLMAGECQGSTAGYTALGRLYALGYLRGLLEATEGRKE
ncbi:MAG: mannonate dehydratase [Oscillospiraceae bacterium]|nr:mannonate dehydratase [Oscillospiraceae bacterium]